MLNKKLIEKQGLNEKEVKLIEEKHSELSQIIDMLNKLEWNEENKQRILLLSHNITLMEFTLQKLWKFDLNENFHTHWLKNIHCSCPKQDNLDIYYFGKGKIISSECKIHGEII